MNNCIAALNKEREKTSTHTRMYWNCYSARPYELNFLSWKSFSPCGSSVSHLLILSVWSSPETTTSVMPIIQDRQLFYTNETTLSVITVPLACLCGSLVCNVLPWIQSPLFQRDLNLNFPELTLVHSRFSNKCSFIIGATTFWSLVCQRVKLHTDIWKSSSKRWNPEQYGYVKSYLTIHNVKCFTTWSHTPTKQKGVYMFIQPPCLRLYRLK